MELVRGVRTKVEPPQAESTEDKYFRNGEVLVSSGDYHLARVIYSHLHSTNPQKAIFLERLALCYKELGEAKNADLAYEQLLLKHSGFRSLIMAGNYYLDQRNFVRAKACYLKGICHQEEDYLLLFDLFKNLGNVFLHEGDFDQAEEYYNKAYRIFDGSDLLHVNYGSLFLQSGNLEKSLEHFQSALSINSKSAKAHLGLSLLYRGKDDDGLAWANLAAATECEPENISALKMLASWSLTDFKYDLATTRLEEYVAKNEYHQEINVLLACLYFQAGFREQAFWEAQKILIFDPSNQDCLKLVDAMESVGEE